MEDIKISVIMPVYNAQAYLKRSLDSLCVQTLKEIEVIMINDESKDSSLDICMDYCKKDQRFHVVSKKNEGAGIARNKGLELARGEYIAFLDADDFVKKNTYQLLYELAKKNNADACMGGYLKIGKNGEVLKTFVPGKTQVINTKEGVIHGVLYDIIGAPPDYHTDVILGTSVWKTIFKNSKVKEYQVTFHSEREVTSEDTIFNIDFFSRASTVVILSTPLYMYCVNELSLSRKFRTESYFDIKRLYLEERIHLGPTIEKEVEERVQRSYLGNTRTVLAQAVRSLPFGKSFLYIKGVCNDPELQDVLSVYPYHKNPIKIRLFNNFLQHSHIVLLWTYLKIYVWFGNIH